MTFISYAQNFEDVMLWRALRHVEKGFYIDVGANDPSIESVTKAFYERGWCGINIEPLSGHYADLQKERECDVNIRCAAGSSKGEIEIWECDVRGWASVDKVAIERHTAMGNVGEYHRVPMTTLTEICEQNAPKEIHFLKIDVEGFERSVLEGMDFKRFRPWVIVIEATRPNSTEENYAQWESLLVEANYVFSYADGLNRFYLASEHSELMPALKYPPNVFDDFVRAGHIEVIIKVQQAEVVAQQAEAKAQQAEVVAQQAEAKAQQAEVVAQQAEAKAQQAEVGAQQAEAKAQQDEAVLIAIHNSSSWRLTAPLRIVGRAAKIIFRLPRTAKSKSKEKIKLLLAHAKLYINQRPKLKRHVFALLTPFPSLKNRLMQATMAASTPLSARSYGAIELSDLTPRARLIYDDLKAAIENRSKERS